MRLTKALYWARAVFDSFVGRPSNLISGNAKTGQSLNFLHGGLWPDVLVAWTFSAGREKARTMEGPRGELYAQTMRAYEAFHEIHGPAVVGTCDPRFTRHCLGCHVPPYGKADGPCYGNNVRVYEPWTFFQNWARTVYFRKMPGHAWWHYRQELDRLIVLGHVNEEEPMRQNGIGDTEPDWVGHMRAELQGMQLTQAMFVRRPAVWFRLLAHGFVRTALTLDLSILEYPEKIKQIKEEAPPWAPIVFGPIQSRIEYEMLMDMGIKPRVVFERHYGRVITRAALKARVPQKHRCPTYHDLMRLDKARKAGTLTAAQFERAEKREVHRCFSQTCDCRKCHSVPRAVADKVRQLTDSERLSW